MSRRRYAALGFAAAAATAVGLATTVGTAPQAVASTTAEASAGVVADSVLQPRPTALQLTGYVGALQPNGWYCGPAATRIALSAHDILPSFDDLAARLGTTRNGTASIFDVTRVLNDIYGWARYESVEVPDITGNRVKALREHVLAAINDGDPVVANIKGTITDFAGQVHSYPGGHYVTITGYADGGDTVTVTDPADRWGSNEYQVSTRTMLWWIATRGYTA